MTDGTVDPPRYGRALVIGGSIAGSAAAAALAGFFREVTILDRDQLPDSPAPRRGAPHSHQYHALTVGGRLALEDLLPGLTEEAIAAGVPYIDPCFDMRSGQKAGWLPKFRSDMRLLMPTRTFLEWLIRSRVRALPNVSFLPGISVSGLRARDGKVIGVSAVDSSDDTELTLDADLVVDASGRSSRAPNWLAELGFPKPAESVVNAHWGYTTTYFRPPADWKPGFEGLYLGPTVNGAGLSATRGGAMWRQEGGTWVLTAQGCARDYPPSNEAGVRAYLKSVGSTDLVPVIEGFEFVAPVQSWRNTANRLRDFAGLTTRPERFIALGDSVAALNPIYGQGMSSAAFSARELRDLLADFTRSNTAADLDGFAELFPNKVKRIIINCWNFSTSSDYNVPGVEVDGRPLTPDERPEGAEYARRVVALATEDTEICRKFMESMQMVRTTEWMAEPALQARVKQDWDRLGTLARGE
jgi:2-polyprenyl-6-methoxyphenol hydroxylase-like FAD-dependent oxidoreductase